MKDRVRKLESYGANHLGAAVGTYEPKAFLGQGQVINGAHPQVRTASPEQQQVKANALYSGPAGSHLGAGRILPDGTLDRSASYPVLASTGNAARSPDHMQYGSLIEGNATAAPRVAKFKGLKADPNSANGGIGVTYSNVPLGAGGAPTIDNGVSNYRHSFG